MRYYYLTTQKAESKPQRTYPNGDAIPDSLPESYQPDQHCGNCGAYNPTTKICSTYNAPVLENYWCASWKAK